MKNYLFFLLSFVLLTSCSSVKKPYTEEMKLQLKNMFKIEQAALTHDPKRTDDKKYVDSMNLASDRILRENTEIVKKYFKEYSIPTIKESGEKTCIFFWTFVQHSDHDVKFQAEVMKAMEKELKKGTILKRNYAYLYDRVQKNQGKPQRYGTQASWETGSIQTYPLEKPETVNERRQEMDLGTIEEYHKFLQGNIIPLSQIKTE